MVNRKYYKHIDLKKNVKPDIFQSQFFAQIRQEWLEVTKKFCARRCTSNFRTLNRAKDKNGL